MKKNRIILLVVAVLILAVIAVVLVMRNSARHTLDKYSDFAVMDTASITRVFIADKSDNQVLLSKEETGTWLVNETHKASLDAIKLLQRTLMSLDVKSMVPRTSHNHIITLMATSATKIEIYQRVYFIDLFDKIKWFPYEKRTKTYYIGIETQNQLGTHMLMEGSDIPYVVHIPGFNGFLTTRYSPFVRDWRDHTIFNLLYRDIASIELQFNETPGESFRIRKLSPREFEFTALNPENGSSEIRITDFDTLRVMDYFSAFGDIRFEALLNDFEADIIDSIKSAKPLHVLKIEEVTGKRHVLKSFLKKGPPDQYNLYDEPQIWDMDRMFALINDDEDLILIQYFVFDPLLRPLSYFLPGKEDLQN